MRTSEAFQIYVVQKGLTDEIAYDDFAIWWASEGITNLYKNKKEFEHDVITSFSTYQGKNFTSIDRVGNYVIDAYEYETTGDRWTDPDSYNRNYGGIFPDDPDYYFVWDRVLDDLAKAIEDALLKRRFNSMMRRTVALGSLKSLVKEALQNFFREKFEDFIQGTIDSNKIGWRHVMTRTRARMLVPVLILTAVGAAIGRAWNNRPRNQPSNAGPMVSVQQWVRDFNFIQRVYDTYMMIQSYGDDIPIFLEPIYNWVNNNIHVLFGGGSSSGGGRWL